MNVVYPAIFYYSPDNETTINYIIHFPDFGHGVTQGKDITDGMHMAADWLGIMVADYIERGEKLPAQSNVLEISIDASNFLNDSNVEYIKDKSFVTFVNVDIEEYLNPDEPTKKTLNIPKWADNIGRFLKLNFSQTLTDAIWDKYYNNND